jgi:multimeric flavodoxin WrbA
MKVLVIMGSPRKGNTCRVAERIREILQSYGLVEFEYLWLRDENLGFCRGCFTCIAKGEENCPVKDAAPAIEQKIREVDGVIFASPVYGMNISGLFKVFVDRFSYIFHRPRFFEKKALLLSTAGAVGNSEVLQYLRLVAQVWGFEVAGEAGLITPPSTIPEYRQRVNEEICKRAAAVFLAALHPLAAKARVSMM